MATIPVFGQNNVSTNALPAVRREYLQDTRAQSIGNALTDVGSVVSRIQIEERNKADQAAVMDADVATSQAANDLFNQTASTTLKDAIGVAPKALTDFDTKADEIEKNLTTPRQKAAYKQARAQSRLQFQRQVESHERGQTEAYYAKSRGDYESQQFTNAVTAYDKPDAIEAAQANLRASVDLTPGLDSDQKATDFAEKSSKVYAGVIDRYLANEKIPEAEAYYQSVKDKVSGNALTQIENDLRVAKDRLKSKLDAGLAEERQIVRAELADVEAAFRSRIPVTSIPSEARMVTLFGEPGKKMYQTAVRMQKASAEVANLDNLNGAELVKAATSYKPTSQYDAATKAEIAGVVSQNVANVLAERKADPVGYLQSKSPTVSAAYHVFSEDPNDATRAEYLTAVEAERTRLGIIGDEVLSKSEESVVVDRMTKQSDSRSLIASIQAEQARWGADFPRVFQQVGKDLPDVAYLIPNVPAKAADVLASVSQLKDDELKKGLGAGVTYNDVVADVQSGLDDLRRSFPVDGIGSYEKIESGTVKLAIGYMSQGMSAGNATKQAVKDSMSQHDFHNYRDHSFRIPKVVGDRPLDTDAVVNGAAQALKTFQTPSRIIPKGAVEHLESERIAADIKKNAYWVTAPDESGLWLFNRYQPVGHPPISYTWDELLKLSGDAMVQAQKEQATRRSVEFVPVGPE